MAVVWPEPITQESLKKQYPWIYDPVPVNPRELPPPADALIDSLKELVSSTSLTAEPVAYSVHTRAGALFTCLRAHNRALNAATRAHKQETADTRHEMDQTYLLLQNLLYERRHLEREIEKCRQFASIYQDIPLYTPEEFVERAPEDMRTEDIVENEHLLMISRLNFELAERQRLEKRQKELLQQKEALLRESKAKTAAMDNVKTQIDTLMKTATDVQKKVGDIVQSAVSVPPSS